MRLGYRKQIQSKSKNIISTINVTPFVDVVLVLLVIFMLTAPMLDKGFDIKLPNVESSPIAHDKKEQVVLSIDKNGDIKIKSKEFNLKQVVRYLQQYQSSKVKIFIAGDTKVNYGKVMEIMSVISSKGFNNILLVTDPVNK